MTSIITLHFDLQFGILYLKVEKYKLKIKEEKKL